MAKQVKPPRKSKAKPSRARATTHVKSMRGKIGRKTASRDPLDDLVDAAARALGLKIEPAWKGPVKANLKVTLALAALFADFPLLDDAELAPIFSA